jgi:acetylornithine deacetylase/succinyl-diaminopimelate desuccinylase-like protein
MEANRLTSRAKRHVIGSSVFRFVMGLSLITVFASSSLLRASRSGELRPAVKKNIREADVISLTQQLVRIRSDYDEGVVANHREMAIFLGDYLKKLGMEVHVIEPEPNYPTVIGRLKGTTGTPKLGLLGHYNTVMIGDRSKWTVDPFGGEYRDGRIYGLGASDQKMAIASTLLATKAIIDAGIKLKGDLVLLYIPGEGAQVHSLPYISKNQPELLKADWFLDTEGGPSILKMATGWTWVKVHVAGVTGHTGGGRGDGKPGRPVNAIYKLAKVLTEIEKFDNWMTYKKHPLFPRPLYDGKPIVEVGKIEGGYKVNQVPDWADAQVDIRFLPGQSPDGVLTEMRALFDRLKKEDPQLNVTVEPMTTQWVPQKYWEKLNDNDPFIKVIREVAPAYIGRVPEWSGGMGGGRPDLWETGAIYVSFGTSGGGGNGHSPNEFANPEAGVKRASLYAELLLRMLE